MLNINTKNFGQSGFKTKRQKFGASALILFLIMGVMFSGIGTFMLRNAAIDESWARVKGKVADASSSIRDGETVYTPVVAYEVQGQEYRVTANYSSGSYPSIGEEREVAYNPARPADAKIVSGTVQKLLVALSMIVGAAMIIFGPFLFIKSLKRSNRIKQLIQTGQKLQGILIDVQNSSGSGKSNYRIVVSAADNSGTVRNYFSDTLDGLGDLAMADFHHNPVPIDVYLDPVNSENYYVDISDIPNLTPQRIMELVRSATSRNEHTNQLQEQETVQPTPQPASLNNPPSPPQQTLN